MSDPTPAPPDKPKPRKLTPMEWWGLLALYGALHVVKWLAGRAQDWIEERLFPGGDEDEDGKA